MNGIETKPRIDFETFKLQKNNKNNKQINITVGMTNGELTKMCLLKDNNLNYVTKCRMTERNVCEVW